MRMISKRTIVLRGLALGMGLGMGLPCFVSSASAQRQIWLTQFGTSESERADALASDGAGGVYVGGYTHGDLMGPNAGPSDAFLARISHRGESIWERQFGGSREERVLALVPDSMGGVYAGGSTSGSLGGHNAGGRDGFVARYDKEGNQLWLTQFGGEDGQWVLALAPDGVGGVFAGGYTEGHLVIPSAGREDAFLTHIDAAGTQTWIWQLGTPEHDQIKALASDGVGGVYVVGRTEGGFTQPNLGAQDVFIARYDSAGSAYWFKQFGTSGGDRPNALVCMENGDVIVAGGTEKALAGTNKGRFDAFMIRYDSAGERVWVQQFGSKENDRIYGLALDGAGGFYAGGSTGDILVGTVHFDRDAFLGHFDGAGRRIELQQLGVRFNEEINALATDGAGGVFAAGYATGDFGGPNAGSHDVFLGRFGKDYCYADCDQATGWGALNIFDFLCFQDAFVNGETYACDCDLSTGIGVCDMFDFLCFQDAFVSGCP